MLQTRTHAAASAVRPAIGLKFVMWVALLAVGGTVALSSWAQPAEPQGGPQGGPPPHMRHHPGPRGGEFGGVGPGLFMGPPEHTDRAVDHLLRGINATDAQRTQIQQIARTASADLKPIHETVRGLHAQTAQLFTAPTVDARAVEAARAQMVAQHDQASKRITQAMLDISNVLSPEQRAKLAEQMKQRQERMKERMKNGPHPRRGAASAPAQ